MCRSQAVVTVLLNCLVLLAGPDLPTAESAGRSPTEGIWQGALKISGLELRVLFRIKKNPEGALSATLDSPDQGIKGIPVDEVELSGRNLSLNVKLLQAVFKGRLDQEGVSIDGLWKQSGVSLPLVLKRIEKAPVVRRPQNPKRPFPYDEQKVVVDNTAARIRLAGTLTLPRTAGPRPAVLLISGSGPQDRDQTMLGHRPFLVLADYLTRRGVAVLRVDDREVGSSTGKFSEATTMDFVGDALAGVEYLKSHSRINSKQIGLIGHSEGGLVAALAAARSPEVAFIVMMAGPGLTAEEIALSQNAMTLKATGAPERVVALLKETVRRDLAVVKQESNSVTAEKRLRENLAWQQREKAKLSRSEQEWLDSLGDTSEAEITMLLSPWFREVLTLDPRTVLRKIECPVLAMVGELDQQLAPEPNLRAIEEALQAGGNRGYEVRNLPGLNHLFQTATTGALSEYTKIEETISPVALEMIAEWILHVNHQDRK